MSEYTIDFSELNRINDEFFCINNTEKEDSNNCKNENDLSNKLENLLINELKGLSKDEISSIVDRANEIYNSLNKMDNDKIDSLIKSLKDKDFDKINQFIDNFFSNNNEKGNINETESIVEYEDPYKDKMNICIDFQNKIINSLSNIYKGSELKEAITIVKSFMIDFIDAPAFEDQSANDLKEYFDFISSLIAKMNKDEIEYGLKLLKSKDYNSVQDFIDNISKEDK